MRIVISLTQACSNSEHLNKLSVRTAQNGRWYEFKIILVISPKRRFI